MYARAGAGPPAMVTLPKNVDTAFGDRLLLGRTDATDGAAGAGDRHRGGRRFREADALEHRVSAEAAGELADTLDGLVTALADDIVAPNSLPRATRSG